VFRVCLCQKRLRFSSKVDECKPLLTGQIQVDVSHAATTSGLYTENCIVVAEVRPASQMPI